MENLSSQRQSSPIHANYKLLKVLRGGHFGTLIKCINRDTNEVVIMKISKCDLAREASIMRILMEKNLEDFNIIRCNGSFYTGIRLILEYECLDISLKDHLRGLTRMMSLKEIRTVIQQLAVALDALKRVNVIHTAVKPNNILLVNHDEKPLRVKLANFKQAIFRNDAEEGMIVQPLKFRAPEIILELPFSESIDVWSLGHVLAYMLLGTVLFDGSDTYETLYYMTDLLGPPPQHLLDAGGLSEKFFRRRADGSWILKKRKEFYFLKKTFIDSRMYIFHSLDELKTKCHRRENQRLDAEWMACIELLKAMLQWDEKDRITPSGILNHPFITESYHERSNQFNLFQTRPTTSQAQMTQEVTPVKERTCGEEALPPGTILVQLAAPKNRTPLDEKFSKDSDKRSEQYDAPQPTHKTSDDNKKMERKFKKKDEEIKKLEEQIKMKDKEIKMKDENISEKDEKIKLKDEEIRMKDENISEKDEKIKKLEEQIKKKDEEIEIKDENIKKKDGKIKKLEEQIKKKDEEIEIKVETTKKLEVQIKMKDEEIDTKDEEILMKDENINEKDKKIKMLEEQIKIKDEEIEMKVENINEKYVEIKMKEEEIKRKDEEIKMKDEEIGMKDEEIKMKDENINEKDETIKKFEEQMRKMKEQIKKLKEQIKIKDEEIKTKDEEIEMKIESINEKDEAIKMKHQEIETRDENINEKDEAIKMLEEQVKKKDKMNKMKSKNIKNKDEKINEKDEKIRKLEEQIKQLKEQIEDEEKKNVFKCFRSWMMEKVS